MAADLTEARGRVEAVYRSESRRVFATLVRLLGDALPFRLRAIRPLETGACSPYFSDSASVIATI